MGLINKIVFMILCMGISMNILNAETENGKFKLDLTDSRNLSFSLDEIGSSKVPRNWSFPLSPAVSLAVVNDSPQNLPVAKSLEVDYTHAGRQDYSRTFLSDFIKIDPAKKYIQTVWLKTEGLTPTKLGVTVGRMFFDEAKKPILPEKTKNQYFLLQAGNTSWAKYQQELVPYSGSNEIKNNEIPANAQYVKLLFLSYGYNRKYWITGHQFEPQREQSTQNLADNQLTFATVSPASEFTINGKLDNPAWQENTNWYSGFSRTICNKDLTETVKNQTSFKIVKDNKYVYLGIKCISSDPKNVVTQGRPINNSYIFSDEDVEIFLDGSGAREKILQIGINPSASFATRFNGAPIGIDMKCLTAMNATGWTAEVKIPLERLWQIYNEAGSELSADMWNINICRHQPNASENEKYSAWIYTGGYNFCNPQALGLLLLNSPRQVFANKLANADKAIARICKENDELMKESMLPEVCKAQEKVKEIVTFKDILIASFNDTDALPTSAFSRYIGEITSMPMTLESIFKNLKRLTIFFPKEREQFGYILFRVPLTEKVSEERLPDSSEMIADIKLKVAGDEIKSYRFALFTQNDFKNVTLMWDELKSDSNEIIPKENIDPRIIQPWGSFHQADIMATDLRVPFTGWLEKYYDLERIVPQIPARSTKQFMLQVKIPNNQKPGIYRGILTISPENAQATRLPFEVNVLPFNLERTKRDVGFFSHSILHQKKASVAGTSATEKMYHGLATETSLYEELKLLAESGFTFIPMRASVNGPLDVDYTRQLLTVACRAGISRVALMGGTTLLKPLITANALSPEKALELEQTKRILSERITEIVRTSKDIGGEELLIFGADEPKTPQAIAVCNTIFNLAKKAGAGTTTCCILEDTPRKIRDMDVLIMNWGTMTTAKNDLLDMVSSGRNTGYKKVLYYANLLNDNNALIRLTFGWYLVKSKLGGNVPCGVLYLVTDKTKREPFIDYGDSIYNVHNQVFPTKDRPIPTLRFISARTGVNDLRYIETLEKAMTECKDSGKIAKAKFELTKMLDEFSIYNDKGIYSRNYDITPKMYDDFQDRIQELIRQLKLDAGQSQKAN